MSARAFVDTNVLVYAVDADEPDKRARARAVLEDADPGSLVLSAQVLGEFYVVVTRKLARPLAPGRAREAVDALAKLPVVGTDAGLVQAGIAISQAERLSYWDALIVAAAVAGRCETLLTEDLSEGAEFAGVRVANPLR
jgi:predicted nucleic acid-binding protein